MSATSVDVTILDEGGMPVSTMPKLAAHEPPGHRHLAFSVLLRDDHGSLLLQRRAMSKHHFVGLWGNSCCSHPLPGEPLATAAARRLEHELGIGIHVPLQVRGAFWYRASDPDSGLVEHEYDVVLVGQLPRTSHVRPNPNEVADTAWVAPDDADRLAGRCDMAVPWLSGVLSVAKSAPEHVAAGLVDGYRSDLEPHAQHRHPLEECTRE